MKNKKLILLNFLVRAVLGLVLISCVNWFFDWREIPVNVGINAISFLVSGALGVPGVAMLYGIVACPFL